MSLIEISCFEPNSRAPTDFAAPFLPRHPLNEDTLSHLALVLYHKANVLTLGPRLSCNDYPNIEPNAVCHPATTFSGTWDY